MNPQTKTSAKDFFLNLGVIVSVYMLVGNLLALLFTIINKAYPKVSGYNYFGSFSISWPVATLIIVFPVLVILTLILEKGYLVEPERRYLGIKRWLTYITLFISGVVLAVDLIMVLYYFIDGQEMTTGFILKVITVLVVFLGVFSYFLAEIREKLDSGKRKMWFIGGLIVVLASIVLGFSVLGSPRTQRLYKYDEQKVSELFSLSYRVESYYMSKGVLPSSMDDLKSYDSYSDSMYNDSQTGKPYEYIKTGDVSYSLCADFNKESRNQGAGDYYSYGYTNWDHNAGRDCLEKTVNPNSYQKPVLIR